MISVIIPTLNEEKYLPSLLSDLKGVKEIQEIIIVDGSSEDNTVKLAKKAKTLIISTKKRNGSYQRNLGANKAKGEWLLFIDADMRIPKGTIKKLSKPKTTATPLFTIKNKTVRYIIFVEPANWIARLTPGMFMRGGCLLVKKSTFNKTGGFNPNMAVAEDADLGQRLRKQGPVSLIPTYVYESDRRYKKSGYMKVLFDWWFNSLWCFIFGKSFNRHWHPVR